MHGKPIANTRSVMGIPTAKLAVYWVIGSEIVIFGGLIASYLMHRLAHPEWAFDAAHTDWRIGAVNTFVLLTSSLFAVQAHHYAHKGDGATAAKWLYLTTGGGGLFLMFKAYEWSVEIGHGYTITAAPFWSFYYTAAGIHASHIIAGMIIMMFIAQTAKKNEELHRVENIGLYWHFVDLVWIFLFPLLYIAK
ncbi:MAG: cytochrome c oxidase subunit 3 [Proteobacteria bacterium]|nr:cytochrome c oxidase subunit 3 [Pseudomonadota bacterium]